LWDAAGERVLEIVGAASDSAALRVYPLDGAPARAGVTDMQASADVPYFTLTVAVRDTSAAGAPLLGYIRRYGRLTASSGSLVTKLLGVDAVLRIGTWSNPVWSDMLTRVAPAPAPDSAGGAGDYRAADGARWIGAAAPIANTPWIVWVGYPRTTVVRPLHAFLRRMLVGAGLFVLVGALFGGALSLRITRPLHELAGAAEQIAAGDYSRRVAIDRRDEIGRLSTAFNTMTSRVEEAHGALRETNQLTQFALAAARIGVWQSPLGNGAMTCSDSMALVHGIDADALPQNRAAFLALVHDADRARVRDMLEARSAPDGVFDVQYRALWPDGSVHWIEGKGRVKLDDAGRPTSVLGVSIDVTDRQRLESQLRQSQKMEAVGQLAGGVAHDFNNLLTAILGHGNILLDELAPDTETRADVVEILNAADSAARLTHQLLAFSRQTVMQPEIVSINDVIARTEKLLRRLIPEHIEVVTSLDSDVPAVRVDIVHLEQVIMNLAVNARDAMPAGGTLTIASGTARLDGRESFAGETPAPGTYTMLAVTDSGAGMSAEIISHIFEPFFTTKPIGQGTGLGLATVFGIVRQSRGYIDVQSEPGDSTTFRIYLPAATAPGASSPRPAESVATRTPGGGETVLVVEDDAAVRAIARRILERYGYRVEAAASGEEALLLLTMHDLRPDLVLTDVVMPGMTGAELYREIAPLHPGLRVLFTSGYAADALDRYGIEEIDGLFIEKPYSPDELAKKVREALAGRAV
jgi:PAS domain S-box-containing protein